MPGIIGLFDAVEVTSHAASVGALSVRKQGANGLLRSGPAGPRGIAIAERHAEDTIRSFCSGAARRAGVSLCVMSDFRSPTVIKHGAACGTLVIKGLSGPQEFVGNPPRLITAPRAVMAAIFNGVSPAFVDCLAATVVNLDTGLRVVAGRGIGVSIDHVGEPLIPHNDVHCDPQMVFVSPADRDFGPLLTPHGLSFSTDWPSVGLRSQLVAAGLAGASIGWTAGGPANEDIIGIALAFLAKCSTIDFTGTDMAFRPISDLTATGTGYVLAETDKLATKVSTAIGSILG